MNKKILLGITGGIAAYKMIDCVRLLREKGCDVKVVLTQSAQTFVTPLTLQAISGNPVYTNLFDETAPDAMRHIELAKWADIILIAPASANTIAKIALGMADDLLTTVCLATQAKLFIAPAMNKVMWENTATKMNIDKLIARDAIIIGPESGLQACGDNGFGRMMEPEKIISELENTFAENAFWKNKKIIITAGPTQEPIDPIRFLSNKSSGKMGYAIAESAAKKGAQVILISGPTNLAAPQQVKLISVLTAQEMHDAVFNHIDNTDVFIGAAAVANYSIENVSQQKIKSNNETLSLSLIKNIDIIHAVSDLEKKPFIVGFAAETEHVIESAIQKLKKKNMDLIVANDVSNNQVMGCDTNQVTVINRSEETISLPALPKKILANKLLDIIECANRSTLFSALSIT